MEATLNAALADAEVAEQVRSGRLLRAASYAGFGEVPRPQLRLVTGGDEEPEAERPARDPAGKPSRRAARPGRRSATEQAERASRGRSGRAAERAPGEGAGQGAVPTRSAPRRS